MSMTSTCNTCRAGALWLAGGLLSAFLALDAVGGEGGTGIITGAVQSGGQVRTAFAIDRQSGKTFPGSIDRARGVLTIGGLPLELTYDCVVEYTDAAAAFESRVEGVNLSVPRSDYVEEQPLSEEDVATIQSKIRKMNQFEDVVEILAIEGNIQHAVIVLNKLRTKPFYDSKPGEVIWRLELWHYERPEETWYKVRDELGIVLHRERVPRSVYDTKSLVLDPVLGGLQPSAERPMIDLGTISLPPARPGIRMRIRENSEKPRENAP